MKELTPEVEAFKALKQYLYRASNALSHVSASHPDLEKFPITLEDGHQLCLSEVRSWIEAARKESWRFAPSEIRRRHVKQIVSQQPRG
jgi:hypothetical protein